MKKILIPIPAFDFDPSECAIPWLILVDNGHEVIFATPEAKIAICDQIMLTGKNLGLLSSLLAADQQAVYAYKQMEKSLAFKNPIKYNDINVDDFDAIVLPGGHAKGMKEYLESTILQNVVAQFFSKNKLVAAICHGVVLVARSKHSNGESVLKNKKTTSLLKSQELLAYGLTYLWLKDYYRTYPQTVEAEIKSILGNQNNFINGPLPIFRDTLDNPSRGFAVIDENYISSRWPGDAHHFALKIIDYLKK